LTGAPGPGLPAALNELPVRIGVALVGVAIVFGLMLVARSLNRRAQT
jgi:D-alanyl-D-alanine carboxypeptidase (penicillin-binding protein 5/6)